jgi:hypothetical protein
MSASILNFEPTEDAITLHGLGFLQVRLERGQRLHVWHPDLPRRACFRHSQIHDHRFGFVSRVLVGEQINHVYRVVEGAPTHMSYLHEGKRTRFGNRPWLPDGEVRIERAYGGAVPPGGEYEMRPYDYHSTEPGGDGRVATLMTKTSEGARGAHSLCDLGIEPDADFDRKQWPTPRLWGVVCSVLNSARA